MQLESFYSKKPEKMTNKEYFRTYGPEGIPEGRFKEGREYNVLYNPYSSHSINYTETDLKELFSYSETGIKKEYIDFLHGNKNKIYNILINFSGGLTQDTSDQLIAPDEVKKKIRKINKVRSTN